MLDAAGWYQAGHHVGETQNQLFKEANEDHDQYGAAIL